MGSKLININIKHTPIVYTNQQLRKGDKSGNYIEGIHRELYNVLNSDIINMLKNTLGNKNGTTAAVYGGGDMNAFIEDMEHGGVGIAANVAENIAGEVLEVAKFYCPVDTGNLRDSGRIEWKDGICYVVFDAPYAWFVHEFTWREIHRDKNPHAIHKWLDVAVRQVKAAHYML